ncbi:MAG: hypothetical protein U0169_06210 [Polyangiaceae bacterium]
MKVQKGRTTDDALHEPSLIAADAVGSVMEFWGFRRVLGRIWTVLYLEDAPLSAQELGAHLAMSSGSVSTSLTELQEWGVVKRVLRAGERREYFEAETDFWKMFSKVINEREKFLVANAHQKLRDARAMLRPSPRTERERAFADRLDKLIALAKVAESVIEAFVASRRADFSTFGNLLQLVRPSPRR